MNKKIIIDIKSKQNIEFSQEVLDKILEFATENIDVDEYDMEIKVE